MPETIIHASDLPRDVVATVSKALGKVIPPYAPAEYLVSVCVMLGLNSERDKLVDAIADCLTEEIMFVG